MPHHGEIGEQFCGTVQDAGGGAVDILVDRDTEQYPAIGSRVRVFVNGGDYLRLWQQEHDLATGALAREGQLRDALVVIQATAEAALRADPSGMWLNVESIARHALRDAVSGGHGTGDQGEEGRADGPA